MTIAAYNPAYSTVYMGVAADTKPTNVIAGSKFIETDTGKVFLFYNSGSWQQVALISASGWTEAGLSVGV